MARSPKTCENFHSNAGNGAGAAAATAEDAAAAVAPGAPPAAGAPLAPLIIPANSPLRSSDSVARPYDTSNAPARDQTLTPSDFYHIDPALRIGSSFSMTSDPARLRSSSGLPTPPNGACQGSLQSLRDGDSSHGGRGELRAPAHSRGCVKLRLRRSLPLLVPSPNQGPKSQCHMWMRRKLSEVPSLPAARCPEPDRTWWYPPIFPAQTGISLSSRCPD